MNDPDYTDQKVSITLSFEANRTITSDMELFRCSNTWAGFINLIVLNYKSDSLASIKMASKSEYHRLAEMLHPNNPNTTHEEDSVINRLVNKYSEDLRAKMKAFPSDSKNTKKIRMQNDNTDVLILSDKSRYMYEDDYSNAGTFVKAILEDYARLPFNRREEIVFKDTVEEIKNCIHEKGRRNVLEVDYISRDNNKFSFEFIPFDLRVDKQTGYQYCIGLRINSQDKDTKLYPLRIYRIKEAKKTSRQSHISENRKREIENTIDNKGIAYLLGETEQINVALTTIGENKYRSILHLRPMHTNREFEKDYNGNNIYVFDCTVEQIRNYFFQFGKEATIIEPSELKEEFYNKYDEVYIPGRRSRLSGVARATCPDQTEPPF